MMPQTIVESHRQMNGARNVRDWGWGASKGDRRYILEGHSLFAGLDDTSDG